MPSQVLLVEDDEDDQLFFQEALQKVAPQAKCTIARDGQSALEMLQAKQIVPDCIFMDINMPGMGGLECLIHLKRDKHLRHIPVIILSTSNDESAQRHVNTLRAEAYFTKPATLRELQQLISRCIQKFIPAQNVNHPK